MAKIIKKAYPISQWESYGNKGRYKDSTREVENMIIGKTINTDGTETYIIEKVYSDLLRHVNSKLIKVHVDVYSEPMVVMERNGKFVPHNLEVEYLKEDIIDILRNQPNNVSNHVRALCEIRNNQYSSTCLGRATKILRMTIGEDLDGMNNLNYDLIKFCLKEEYQRDFPMSEFEKEVCSMSKEELCTLYGAFIEYERVGVVRIEPLKSIIENESDVDIAEIDRVVKNEFSRRCFSGEFH